MTDPIASAAVLVVPDMTQFRQRLEAELNIVRKTIKPLAVPVVAVSAGKARGVAQQSAAVKELNQLTGFQRLAQAEAAIAAEKAAAAAHLATTAANEQAAGYRRLGVAVAEAAKLQELDTAATLKATAAKEALLAVSSADAAATTRFAQLKAVSAAASRAVAVAEQSLNTAIKTGIPVRIQAAEAALAEARGLEASAAAAVADAAAQIRDAKATAGNVAAHEAAGRAVFANTASALGLRGAVLASTNAFIAGTIATIAFFKTISGAEEDVNRTAAAIQLLGDDIGNRLVRNAEKLSTEIGVADDKILGFQVTVGQMLTQVGLTGNQIETMANELTKLAPALALAFGTDTEQAFTALRSGLAGNTRGLRIYGFQLDNTIVKQRALENSGKDNAAQLTKQEIIYARYQLILEGAANAADFFTQQQDGLTAQTRILGANVDKAADAIGDKLLPVVTALAADANFAAKGVGKLADALGFLKRKAEEFIPGGEKTASVLEKIGKVAFVGASPALIPFVALDQLRQALDDGGEAADRNFLKYQKFFQNFDLGESMLANAADALERFEDRANRIDLSNATVEINELSVAFDRLIIAGAGPAAQIVNLKAQQAAAKLKEIAAHALGNKKLEREAIAQQAALAQQINSLQAGIEADAAAAQRERDARAKAAAIAAQKALDDADRRLLFAQQQQQSLQDIANAKAEASATLRDDIREDQDQIRLLTQQIRNAQKIHDRETRLATIAALTIARVNARIKLEDDLDQRRKNLREKRQKERERAKDAAAALVEKLDISAQIAEVQDRTKDQIRFLQAEVKALIAERKLVGKNTVEYKRLTLAIEQKKKAIRELKDEQDELNRDAQALAFSFLQQQQGFAATLLSNILPGSAFAGTVGGGGGGAGPITPPGGGGGGGAAAVIGGATFFPQGAGPVGVGIVDAAQKGGGPASPTRGQQATTNEILRQILTVLIRQARGEPFAAARHQRAVGSAAADIL